MSSMIDSKVAPKCRFCQYFRAGSGEVQADKPWLLNGSYAALVSKGALVPGWSLVCPIDHGLNLTNHFERAEFWQFCAEAEGAIRRRYGEVRVFEHGAAYEGSNTGCGTDHAHLHIVPLEFRLTTEAIRFTDDLQWSPCRAVDIRKRVDGREYLFVADSFNGPATEGLLCILSTPVSQFFRRVIASRLGLREFYDYKKHPMLEIANASSANLASDVIAGASLDSRI